MDSLAFVLNINLNSESSSNGSDGALRLLTENSKEARLKNILTFLRTIHWSASSAFIRSELLRSRPGVQHVTTVTYTGMN